MEEHFISQNAVIYLNADVIMAIVNVMSYKCGLSARTLCEFEENWLYILWLYISIKMAAKSEVSSEKGQASFDKKCKTKWKEKDLGHTNNHVCIFTPIVATCSIMGLVMDWKSIIHI